MSFFNTFFNIVIGSDRYQHRQLGSFLYLIIMMAEILAQEILIKIMIKFMIVIITNYSLFLIAQDILATMERPPDLPPSRSADYCTKKSFFQVIIMIIVDDEDMLHWMIHPGTFMMTMMIW